MNKFSVGHLADCGGRAMEVYRAEEVDARIAVLVSDHELAIDLHAKQANRIAELESEVETLARSNVRLRRKIDRLGS